MKAWIVDDLKKQKDKQKDDRPRIELPTPECAIPKDKDKVESSNRGVITIQFWDDDEEEKDC